MDLGGGRGDGRGSRGVGQQRLVRRNNTCMCIILYMYVHDRCTSNHQMEHNCFLLTISNVFTIELILCTRIHMHCSNNIANISVLILGRRKRAVYRIAGNFRWC